MPQESQARTGDCGGNDDHQEIGLNTGKNEQARCNDRGHASGQAIQAIEQIDGIGNTHDPYHRNQTPNHAQRHVPPKRYI